MGYVGSGLVVVSYFAAQQRWLSQKSLAYLLANFSGAVLILASLYVDWNFPAALVELFWAAISLYGVLLYRRDRMRSGN
ncbi:CBU_0592 family membrane protein [Methylobacterium sp.]